MNERSGVPLKDKEDGESMKNGDDGKIKIYVCQTVACVAKKEKIQNNFF
jgi:hypothetical protein